MIQAVLLWTGVAGALLCCVGVLIMPTPYDRLHFLSAASTVPTFLIVAAVAIEAGLDADTVKAVLIGVILMVIGPVLTHAIARAIRIREHDGLDVIRERR